MANGNNLVTKPFLKSYLKKQFKEEFARFHKKLKDEDFVQLRRDIRKDISYDLRDFMESSVIPLLDKMDKRFDKVDKNIDEIKFIVDTHERRLDRHDDKLLDHDRLFQKLTA